MDDTDVLDQIIELWEASGNKPDMTRENAVEVLAITLEQYKALRQENREMRVLLKRLL